MNKPFQSYSTERKLAALIGEDSELTWSTEKGCETPRRLSVNWARWWLAKEAATSEPDMVTADESGDVCFEWWRGKRKVTLYFDCDDNELWFLRVEHQPGGGSPIVDGVVGVAEEWQDIEKWLVGETLRENREEEK